MWVSCVPYSLEEKLVVCCLVSKAVRAHGSLKYLTLWGFFFLFCSLQRVFKLGKIINCKISRARVGVPCRSFMLSAQPVCAYAECSIFNCRLVWELASFEGFFVWFIFWIFFFLLLRSKILR